MKRILSALFAGLAGAICCCFGADVAGNDDSGLPLVAAGRLDLDGGKYKSSLPSFEVAGAINMPAGDSLKSAILNYGYPGQIMNDFTSAKEKRVFETLGEMPKAKDQPSSSIDAYLHGIDLVSIEEDPNYVDLMQRFSRSFSGMFKSPGGGDVLFEV